MHCLTSLRVPTNYYNAPLKHVANNTFSNMKVHDWYVSMQQLSPLCLHGLLYKLTQFAIMCLSYIFRGCTHNWGTKKE